MRLHPSDQRAGEQRLRSGAPAYRKHLGIAKTYFESAGILLCGRVAEHEYINMDVCIERGMAVARRLNAEA